MSHGGMSDVSNRNMTVLLIMLEVRVDKDGNHRLCLLIIGNPSRLSSRISLSCVCGGSFHNVPPPCHSKQSANLARPLRVVFNASKNGSAGLDSGVDVERHFLEDENIRYESLHEREIISIVQLNRSKRYGPRCKLCGVVVRVQILILCVCKVKFRGSLRFL
jgi:hypothetical protein